MTRSVWGILRMVLLYYHVDNHVKHRLGHRAFFLFLARRVKPVIFLGILTAAIWYGEQWLPADYLIWSDYAVKVLALVTAGYFAGILFLTYMEYRVYTYSFTDEAFLMTSGIAVRNEVAALYHQIQNVNISRSMLDRTIGVSKIIILMTGSDVNAAHNRIILPAVGKSKAQLVQKELLVRARRHAGHAPGNPS